MITEESRSSLNIEISRIKTIVYRLIYIRIRDKQALEIINHIGYYSLVYDKKYNDVELQFISRQKDFQLSYEYNNLHKNNNIAKTYPYKEYYKYKRFLIKVSYHDEYYLILE